MYPAVIVQDLWKQYSCYHSQRPRTIMEAALSGWRHIQPKEHFWVLRDVSLTVLPGEMLGIIGKNGAGKSTLLQLIGGVIYPDKGKIQIKGRIAAMLYLGSAFHPDLTGRENVLVNGVVAGLTRREVVRRFEEIVEFAELQEFIDNPVRTYSTGMNMRLAFSVAVHTTPEVLLVDEFLSVGDLAFQNKCLEKIFQLKAEGCAIVLIAHNIDYIEQRCDRALWLHHGQVMMEGEPKQIVAEYLSATTVKPEQHKSSVSEL